MKVIAKKNRELALINARNTQNENRTEIIELVVPEEYENYNKKIVFITSDGNVWDVIINNEYKITNAITKYKQVDFYIWLTKEVDGESIDFRTKTKTLKFYHNEDASDEITDEEIHGVNTVVNLLEEEIEKVENLNIEATKIGDTTTVTITKKDGTTESVEINDGADGQDGRDGQDGQDGYTPQKGIDYFTQQDIEEIETDVKEDVLDEVYTKSETDTLLEGKADVEDIPDVSSFITKDVNNLTYYTLKTNTGSLIDLEINDTTYVVTLKLKNQDGTVISTDTIDLPLESVVVSGRYDNTTKKVILTLENGSEVDFSVADLVAGLQTEITSQNKLASDLVDDTNSGNKFVTTTEKQTWNNKLDESDLTDYVKNTDYATDSKGGVIKSSSGYSNSIVNGILVSTTKQYTDYNNGSNAMFISKGTLENVITGKQLINQTQLEESQETQDEQIEKLKATLPTTTGEGKDIALDKTAELEFKKPPLPMGNSEQETNLYDGKLEQGSIAEGEETTANDRIRTNNFTEVISGTEVPITANSSKTIQFLIAFYNSSKTFLSNSGWNSIGTKVTMINNTKYIKIVIKNSDGSNISPNDVTNFVIGASPNPDYPQEITNVTGDVEIVVENKNFLNMDNSEIGGIDSSGNIISGNNLWRSNVYIEVEPNTTYTLSRKIFNDNLSRVIRLYEYDNNKTFISPRKESSTESLTITTTANTKYLKWTIFELNATLTKSTVQAWLLQLELGTATTYTAHQEQTFIFPLGNEKLMLGDYLADDGIHHVRGQVRLDSLTWEYESYANRYKCNNVSDLNIKGAVSDGEPSTQILSNIFTVYSNNWIGSNNFYDPGIAITTTGLIRVKYIDTTDVNVFETMLTNKNGILEYELEQEVIVPYTSAQQEVYNQIKQVLSYEEQTNISSNTIALFSVEAYQNTKLILKEMATAIVALGGV